MSFESLFRKSVELNPFKSSGKNVFARPILIHSVIYVLLCISSNDTEVLLFLTIIASSIPLLVLYDSAIGNYKKTTVKKAIA